MKMIIVFSFIGQNQPVKSKDSTGHEDKTKLMTNNINGITSNIKVNTDTDKHQTTHLAASLAFHKIL